MNDFTAMRPPADGRHDTALTAAMADPGERRILDLVRESHVTARLMNAICAAARERRLPFKTVGEYLNAGSSAQAAMLRSVRNFGRKTARELEELISAQPAGAGRAEVASEQSQAPDPAADRARLMGSLAGVKVRAVIDGEILSARLMNVLRQSHILDRPLIEVVENLSTTAAAMLRFPNCGRKSVDEFCQLCRRYLERILAVDRAEGEPPTVINVRQLLSGRSEEAVDEAEPGPLASTPGASLAVPDHSNLGERLEWLLGEQDARAAAVIRRRYGIGYDVCATLEEVGRVFGVTRERIRQIELKSLKRLRIRARRVSISELLADEAYEQWRVLSGDALFLRLRDLPDRRGLLCRYVALALDVLEFPLVEWLDRVAVRFPYGWHAPGVDRERVEKIARAVAEAVEGLPLPRSINGLVTGYGGDEAAAACELGLGCRVRNGYITPPRVGPRLARAIGLHSLLADAARAVAVQVLLQRYHECFPRDLCAARDAEIVMEAAPHLFLEVEEDIWVAVGAGGPVPQPEGDRPPARATPIEGPGTIAFALQETLRRLGPTRLGDLLQMAPDILPSGRSVNSVGPVLLMRRELFVRLLPGVYGIPEHVPPAGFLPAEARPILLSETQARLYALARYAGEPRGLFPLWSARAEYELCRWARHSGDAALYRSLLSVADVDQWPISDPEREEWLFAKRHEGRFEIGLALRRHAAYSRPALDRVLAAILYGIEAGGLNWMAANRLTGRKLDSHAGAGLLILLLQLEALAEPSENGFRWQMHHRVTAAAYMLRDELLRELSRSGHLSWESELGRNLASRAVSSGQRAWVDAVAVASMFEGAASDAEPDEEEGFDPVELLMAAHRREREQERREATLQWLLEA